MNILSLSDQDIERATIFYTIYYTILYILLVSSGSEGRTTMTIGILNIY